MKKLTFLLALLATALTATAEDYILYTTCDNKALYLYDPTIDLGAKIISNTYENGQGKILFDGEVTKIGPEAFLGMENLESMEIPNSVTEIGFGAFECCNNLKSVVIGNSVTKIGQEVFTYCDKLESFSGKFASDDHRCLVVDGSLVAFAQAGLTTYQIPNTVTKIKNHTFTECVNLTSVEIPNSVTEIENGAFILNTSLESFTGKFASEDHRCLVVDGSLVAFAPAGLTSYQIPTTVTKIGDEAFQHCHNLESVVIPNSVTEIGNHAFVWCINLTSIVLGNSVAKIGDAAFGIVESQTEIISLNTTPPSVGINCFDAGRTVKVPAQSVDAYKAATGWQDLNIVALTDEELEALPVSNILAAKKDAPAYNLSGRRVGDGYKGIVVREGRKMLRK